MVRRLWKSALPFALVVAFGTLASLVAGCNEDEPVAPPPAIVEKNFATLWPNQDGSWWQYDVVRREWGDNPLHFYSTPEQVPPAPSCVEVVPWVDVPFDPRYGTSESLSYELRFSGLVTTESGVTRQNLQETLVGGTSSQRTAGSLWRMLTLARPELRARLQQRGALADTTHESAMPMLHGYAWEKTSQWIGTYGDLDTLLAWKYLEPTVTPGHEFTHQLVPSLSDDVFLHARIVGSHPVTTPAGTFTATRCVYVIDYGIGTGTDSQGQLGFYRYYDFGCVDYVDDRGPVAAYERLLVPAGQPQHSGLGDVTAKLVRSGLPAMASLRF